MPIGKGSKRAAAVKALGGGAHVEQKNHDKHYGPAAYTAASPFANMTRYGPPSSITRY